MFYTKICIVSDNLIESLCPLKNENNRNRAEQLIMSGSILYPSKRHVMVKSRIDDDKDMLMIKINVIPSIKTKVFDSTLEKEDKTSEHHTSCLSFDALSSPHYSCGCYDGRHFFSHFLSVLLFIRCAQRSKLDVDEFDIHLPKNALKTQNQLTNFKISHKNTNMINSYLFKHPFGKPELSPGFRKGLRKLITL